jgi:hypothetical protein
VSIFYSERACTPLARFSGSKRALSGRILGEMTGSLPARHSLPFQARNAVWYPASDTNEFSGPLRIMKAGAIRLELRSGRGRDCLVPDLQPLRPTLMARIAVERVD